MWCRRFELVSTVVYVAAPNKDRAGTSGKPPSSQEPACLNSHFSRNTQYFFFIVILFNKLYSQHQDLFFFFNWSIHLRLNKSTAEVGIKVKTVQRWYNLPETVVGWWKNAWLILFNLRTFYRSPPPHLVLSFFSAPNVPRSAMFSPQDSDSILLRGPVRPVLSFSQIVLECMNNNKLDEKH